MFMQNLKNAGIFVVVACVIAAATYLMFSIVRFIVRKLNPIDEFDYDKDDYIDAFVSIIESMYISFQHNLKQDDNYLGITNDQFHYIVDCIEANMGMMLEEVCASPIRGKIPLTVTVGTIISASCIGAMDTMFKDARPATYEELLRDPKTPMAKLTKDFIDYTESLDDPDYVSLWGIVTERSRIVDGKSSR